MRRDLKDVWVNRAYWGDQICRGAEGVQESRRRITIRVKPDQIQGGMSFVEGEKYVLGSCENGHLYFYDWTLRHIADYVGLLTGELDEHDLVFER